MRRTKLWLAAGTACWLLVGGLAAAQDTLHYETQMKTATSPTAQTDAVLWTPTTGNRFVLQGCGVSAIAPVRVEFEVSDVDVIPPIYLESYGMKLVESGGAPLYVSAQNAVLTYTTATFETGPGVAYRDTSVFCWGYEEAVLD